MSWPLVKLGDVCERVSVGHVGTTSEFYTDEAGVPFLRTQNVGSDGVSLEDVKYITHEFHKTLRKSTLAANDVVMSRVVSTSVNCGIVPESLAGANCANIILARPIKDKLVAEYLVHYLRSSDVQGRLLARQVGSAQSVVNTGVLKSWEIPLPALHEQKRIAAILDKADAIRRKRQQAIQLADDFLRAVFLDMFGDPVTNPKGWPVEHLKDITTKIGSGSTPRGGSEAYLDQGISLIRSLNIHDDDFRMKNLAFIDDEQAEKLSNVLVQNGDVLLNITGASVCRCAIVPAAVLPARVNQHVCIIRPSDAVNSSYLLHLLISEPYKQKLLKMSGAGATREALTKQQVEMLEVPIPPKDLQTKFEEIKDKVRSLSSASDSFKEESIFESLSDKAFSGLL